MNSLADAKKILDDRRKNASSFASALYQIIGIRYSESNAKKKIKGIEQFLDSLEKDNTDANRVLKIERRQDGSIIKEMVLRLQDVELAHSNADILRLHGYDPVKFQLGKHTLKVWNVYSKKHNVQELMSSAVVAKPVQSKLTEQDIKDVFDKLKAPDVRSYTYEEREKNLLFELPMMDVHLGKFSWSNETNFDYDLKIAEKLYKETITQLVSKLSLSDQDNIQKILFPIGQDFFNFDNEKLETTAGTSQDTDTRWQKMFLVGCELLVWAIDLLRPIAPIEICHVPGNHDYKMSFFALHNINAYYRNTDNVIVNLGLKPRKYYQFGGCMIGYAHGKDEGKTRIKALMSTEAPEIWGKTQYREMHIGHLHSQGLLMVENAGLLLRHISSITANDKWHANSAYIGAIRQAQAFIWDREWGLQTIHNAVVKEQIKSIGKSI